MVGVAETSGSKKERDVKNRRVIPKIDCIRFSGCDTCISPISGVPRATQNRKRRNKILTFREYYCTKPRMTNLDFFPSRPNAKQDSRRDMVHFEARLDTWAHVYVLAWLWLTCCALLSSMCRFYSWLTSFWLRIALFRHGSREAFDGWLTWAKADLVCLFARLTPPLTWLTWLTWACRLACPPRSRGSPGSPGPAGSSAPRSRGSRGSRGSPGPAGSSAPLAHVAHRSRGSAGLAGSPDLPAYVAHVAHVGWPARLTPMLTPRSRGSRGSRGHRVLQGLPPRTPRASCA
jgi:hypothetical protein